MSEGDKFHQIALQSILFKGRYDWYFCYLKSEKIAHVLFVLKSSTTGKDLEDLVRSAVEIPHAILYFAAQEIEAPVLLADILSIVTALRFAATRGSLSHENSQLLIDEYEQIGQKIAADNRPSPFVSPEDFALPAIERQAPEALPTRGITGEYRPALAIKDKTSKGQETIKDSKGHTNNQTQRTAQILNLVKENKGISVKDISATIRDCSEKTIQRELVALIGQGLVRKVGDRRWSLYFPA